MNTSSDNCIDNTIHRKPTLLPYILMLFVCFLFNYAHSQELYIGYNASHYYRGFKQLSIEQHAFNSSIDQPTDPFIYSSIMHGPEFGFGEQYGNFSFSMSWRMRKLKASGSHTYPNGNIEFKELKLTHNVFVMGLFLGDKNGRFRIGYEIELGRFKRRDRLSPDEGWEKLRSGTFTGAFNLVSVIRVGGSDEAGGILIKPYWRMSGYVYKHYYTQFGVNEFYNLQSIGLSATIAINLDK